MSFLSRLHDKRRTVASISTVSIVSTALVALAFNYEGQATADVELNDSGVWVTRTAGGLVGRFNYESQAMDGSLIAGSASFDVLQNAGKVLLDDEGTSTASPVDAAFLKLDGTASTPAGAQVVLGGSTVAIFDGDEGLLWVMPYEGLTSFDLEKTDPTAELEGDGALTVSQDGTVFVAVPSTGTLTTVATTAKGAPEETTDESLAASKSDTVEITTVGDKPVVLNRTQSQVLLPGGKTAPIEGGDTAELQQPGPKTTTVAIETATGLVQQPLNGDDAQVRAASGVPAAPVQLAGCTYGAWSQTGQVLRDCEGTDNDIDKRLDGIDPQSRLAYRVNREAIVLNDLAAGTLWMAADDYEKVDDWDLVLPEQAEGEESDAELSTPEQVDQLVLDRSKPNEAPKPQDDKFGARPGRATILPVLANDIDPDGDVMTATLEGDQPKNATIQQILGGAALQAVVPDDAKGTSRFAYKVDDGRGGTAKANVSLHISPWGENASPEQTGEPVLVVEQGKTAQIKVLPFFRDPDGDDLYLASASATVPGDEVRSRPDGSVVFRDGGGSTGRKRVIITVADGLGGLVEGSLWVDVSGAGQLPPVAVADHVVVPAGQPVTVEPLRNDYDANGDELRLASISESAPAQITPNYDAGTFQFLSNEPRSYDLLYQVTDGPSSTTGLVRVDVLPTSAAKGPPIVVADTALLPAGGKTLVDVLANDTDPAGGVLVVQSVRVPKDAGISVAILGHQMLRITEIRRLDEPVTIEYTVSNGTETSVGQVRVVPVPAPTKLQPPNAAADEVTVRVGDVVNIPVLKNDTHPDGLELFLQKEFEQTVDPEQGEIFVSENEVRFKAGSEAGTAYAIYRVRDKNGQEDSAQITIHIRDGEDNSPPQPRDIQARVLTGATVRVAVPLDGIDPDGDSVQLTGIATSGTKGTATVVDGFIDYQAGESATGLDTFTYSVQDARGEIATGTVQVGISKPGETNQAPVAVDDVVTVRAGRTVAIAALINDTDPDGDQIALVPSALEADKELKAKVVEDRVVVTSPAENGSYTFYYAIEDTFGARASAAITVNVADDAPLLAPIARDDVVPMESILGKTSISVPVLDNDDDPDGAASELTVTVDPAAAQGVSIDDDGVATITLTEQRQVITYTITDIDGLTAKAFVRVPGLTEQKPALRPGIAPLEVNSGEVLRIDITDYVLVLEGRKPRLTEESKVTALEGTRTVVDATNLTYTSNADYVGPAAITFEVTDGSGPDDPEGHKALLTLPITVLPPKNLPPTIGTPTLDVAAGEEAAVDLGRFAEDPDGDALTFTVRGSVPAGVTVTISGTNATAQAKPDVPKGTVVTVPISVTDGEHPPVDGALTLSVVGSTRPLARANEDTIAKAHQGEPTTVPVLANDSNPFPETPLKVIGAAVETGLGDAVVSGSDVVVTPNTDYVGIMVVRYRIQDATNDPDRIVEGSIQLSVQGRPETPAKPEVEEVRSETVVLSWTPPNNNGAEITSYTVRSNNGYEKVCDTTTCTLDGLTNNVEYTFTVVATNEVNDSDPSVPSEIARPDEKPDPPAAPMLTFGDQSLTIDWVNATYTDRSPIESVNLEISPAPPSGAVQKAGLPGTQIVWEGLENGVSYKVRVQAINAAPDPSDWGEYSADEIPAGKPAAPTKPSVQRNSIGEQSQMTVSWEPPDGNGAEITQYTIDAMLGGSVVKSVTAPGGATSQTIDVEANTTDYTFHVRAHNKATDKFGEAENSPESDAVRAFAAPGPPSAVTATATGADGTIQLHAGQPQASGVRPEEISYEYNAGNGWQPLAANQVVTGLTNGTSYSILVRAVAGVGGSATPGAEATAPPAKPYGDPRVPGVSASGNAKSVTVNWSDPGGNGRAYKVQINVDGNGWEDVPVAGSRSVGNGYSETHSIKARTVETEAPGRTGAASAAASAQSGEAPPAPAAWVGRGAGASTDGGIGDCRDPSVCSYFRVHANSTFPSGSHDFQCMVDGENVVAPGRTYNRTLNANSTVDLPCILGINNGAQVWVIIDGTAYEHRTWPDP